MTAGKINPNDASYLRSLNTDGNTQLDAEEAKRAIDGAIRGHKDGQVEAKEVDVFKAASKAKGVSEQVIEQVVKLATDAPDAKPVLVPLAKGTTVQRLPQWLDVSSLRMHVGLGNYRLTLSFYDKDGNTMCLWVNDDPRKVPMLQVIRKDLPFSDSPQKLVPVSPALAEKLADIVQSSIRKQRRDTGADKQVIHNYPYPPEEVPLDPVQDVQWNMDRLGQALQSLNTFAANGPQQMNDTALSPDAVPQVEVPSRDDRLSIEGNAHARVLQLLRRGWLTAFKPEEGQTLRLIKAVDIGPDGRGYPRLSVYYNGAKARLDQKDLASCLQGWLKKAGLEVIVSAFPLFADQQPKESNGKLTWVRDAPK